MHIVPQRPPPNISKSESRIVSKKVALIFTLIAAFALNLFFLLLGSASKWGVVGFLISLFLIFASVYFISRIGKVNFLKVRSSKNAIADSDGGPLVH